MRILVLSNTPFAPPTAGNRARIAEMLAYLQERGAEVALLMLPAADLAEWDTDTMRGQLSHFEIARPPASAPPAAAGRLPVPSALAGPLRPLLGRVARRLRRLLAASPLLPTSPIGLDDWCPPWFRLRAAAFEREWRPDVVLVQYVYLSACLEALDPRPDRSRTTVIDAHDVMHHRRAAYRQARLRPQWFHTTRAEEQRGLARADIVLAIQEEDARTFRQMGVRDPLVVVHGRPVTPMPAHEAEPARLLFVGSYNDFNVRGLQWFIADVWPMIRAAVPDCELIVCGNIAKRLHPGGPGIVFRGVISDLGREYAASRVVINPIQAGTGLKIKVAEALCHGRPVVSTPNGVAGFPASGNGIIVAHGATNFAETIHRLLRDGALWRRQVEAAARYAERAFSREAAFAPLVARLASAQAVASPAPSPPA
jgi:glycosyltransferase involved in cell wall biosynthesis